MEKSEFGGRVIEGRILRAGNSKTRVVAVEQTTPHRLYGRSVKRSRKFVAHDEREESAVGDIVRLRESKPISRTKRWRLVEIVEKARAE